MEASRSLQTRAARWQYGAFEEGDRGTRAAEEEIGAATENHRGQRRARPPTPSHSRTARALPPGVHAGRAAAPPARGRAAASADRPRRSWSRRRSVVFLGSGAASRIYSRTPWRLA